MKSLKRLYYNVFPTYKEVDVRYLTYEEADELIRKNEGKPDSEKWVLSKIEDYNKVIGMVYICKKIRIYI